MSLSEILTTLGKRDNPIPDEVLFNMLRKMRQQRDPTRIYYDRIKQVTTEMVQPPEATVIADLFVDGLNEIAYPQFTQATH